MYEFLKKVPMFSTLSEMDLELLCQMAQEINLEPGQVLINEGEMGEEAYVIQDGLVEITKKTGGRQVLLATRGAGEVIGEMSLLESAPRMASIRAKTKTRVVSIRQEAFDRLLNTSPTVARALLHTFVARLRSNEILLGQNEKMAQLGQLSAGMAHELNNPAAAALRGAEQLRSAIDNQQSAYLLLLEKGLGVDETSLLDELIEKVKVAALAPLDMESLERSDKEYTVESWLEQQGLERSWELAPNLVQAGLNETDLQLIAKNLSEDKLQPALDWLNAAYSIASLLMEISAGTRQISEIVRAMKAYVYLDQAPVQEVDLHEGLDNTLIILRSKIKQGVEVHKKYAPNLPRIQAYGSELNQVWTNILDNAIDAMSGQGHLYLRTRHEGQFVVVELEDNGPGIPEKIQSKIFSPFFTTKPVGKGTGLGLNISWNIIQKHGGEIQLSSRPGKTVFEVHLPINFDNVHDGSTAVELYTVADDETILNILNTQTTIAVVGITNREDLPSYAVPAYLQRQGYRILPINPRLEEVLGEKAYPDLASIPEPIDTVLIFRRSDAVPAIVEEAIKIGAKNIWMQEGIVNEEASIAARSAGKTVVMNTCMRVQHKRLISNK